MSLPGPSLDLGQLLAHRARRHPDRLALVEATRRRRFSYGELEARSNRVAASLRGLGIAPGDRVAMLMQNGVEFVESYFALAKVGAVLVPLNWRLAPDELEFILRDAEAKALLYDQEYDDTVTALRDHTLALSCWVRVGGARGDRSVAYEDLLGGDERARPPGAAGADPLFIMYTSGTTGRPKGAIHTHESFLAAAAGVVLCCDVREDDRELVVLPLFHIGALLPLTWELYKGGTAVALRTFDPDFALEVLETERITTGLVVPTIFQLLLEHPRFESIDHSSLRSLVVGGAPVPPPLAERSAAAGIVALQDYGSTEAALVTIAGPEDFLIRPMSAGRPLVHTDVRIVDADRRERPAGQVGEIAVRGRHVMAGYWRRPEATAEALAGGWFYTGDLGFLDETGCLYVRDRKNDLIISGGENIYPAEVERVLSQWARIREVAVIGQPSARWGEAPVAVVVPNHGEALSAEDLIEFCRGKLAGYKIPRSMVITDLLPRTPTGKIQKHVLRARYPGPAPQ